MVNRRQSASATYILCPQFPQTYILFVLFPSTFPPQPSSLFLTTFTFVPPSTPLPPPRPARSLFSPFWRKFLFFSSRKFFLSLKKKNLFAPSSRFLSRSVGDYKYPAKETFWKTNQICRNHFSSSWQKSNWSQCDWSWKSIKWSLYNKQVGLKVLTEIVQKQKLISNFTKCYKKRQEVKLNY